MNLNVINNIVNSIILPSKIHGCGLFATHDIPVGLMLATLDGQHVPWSIYKMKHQSANDAFNEWNAISPEMLLVRTFRTKYSFSNHSRSPNCKVNYYNGCVMVISISHIPASEEITLDYRMEPLPFEYLTGHGATFL